MNSNYLGDTPEELTPPSVPIELSGSDAPAYVSDAPDYDSSIYSSQEEANHYAKYTKRPFPSAPLPASTWFDVRKHYIRGERKVTDQGRIVSEKVTIKKLSNLYQIDYRTLLNRAKKEGWNKYRDSYLSRIDELNIGLDLDFHSEELVTSEATTVNSLNNLSTIINTFIESKYGELLETVDDPSKILTQQDKETITSATDIKELKELTAIVSNIFKTQQTIYENSPMGQKAKQDAISLNKGGVQSGMTNEKSNMTDKQRQAMLNSIKAKLENLSTK